MVQEVIDKWNPNFFGESEVHRPLEKPETSVGIAKGIPLDASDEQTSENIADSFHIMKTTPLSTREGKPFRSFKIIFKTRAELKKAIIGGISVPAAGVKAYVEESWAKPNITQCYNCWKYGHVARTCVNERICICCSRNHQENNVPFTCNNEPCCPNCFGRHLANDWSNCTTYRTIELKIANRSNDQP